MPDLDHHAFNYEAMTAPWQILVSVTVDKTLAGQAAAAAFAEVDIIEGALSRFRDSSDVSRINTAGAGTPVRVGIHTMECLKIAARATRITGGAFDVTVGPLVAAWRNPDKTPRTPAPEELAAARARVGMGLLQLDEKAMTVTAKTGGMKIDLGGIGKGYAGDCAAEILCEWGISRALVSAGTSTVVALDPPEDREGWPVGVGGVGAEPEPPYMLALKNAALSGSGGYIQGSHIIDPATGRPAEARLSAWSLCPAGGLADALSTAFIIMSGEKIAACVKANKGLSAMVAETEGNEVVRQRFGPWPGLKKNK